MPKRVTPMSSSISYSVFPTIYAAVYALLRGLTTKPNKGRRQTLQAPGSRREWLLLRLFRRCYKRLIRVLWTPDTDAVDA